MISILDCTLRDGGYYTNWDFNQEMVKIYLDSLNQLPIEYIEIGYRSKPLSGYYGEYFYCPVYIMEQIREQSVKKIAIMLNEKDVTIENLKELLKPAMVLIDKVRLAVDPENFLRALNLAALVKGMGFEVGFNVMYMSKWSGQKDFLNSLNKVDEEVDFFNIVDSYGGVFPEDVREIFNIVRERTNVKIGFHGHNNMEMALINTITAIECGADIVDATITGMGRGAGNLKTELLLTFLNAKGNVNFDFNKLCKVVDSFTKLREMYNWGSNLPYMVSGANSLPQKDVMEWVGKRYYSFNSIIRTLNNKSKGILDNEKLPNFKFHTNVYKKALLVGGGPSVKQHEIAIQKYLCANPEMVIIHASSKNALVFQNLHNPQFFCLVGNEGHRLEDVFSGNITIKGSCILPSFPRKMGTFIPQKLRENSFELIEVNFTDKFQDSHTAIALQSAFEFGINSIEVVGYDGYSGVAIGEKEQELFMENEYMFKMFSNKIKKELVSITPTTYKTLALNSIYAKV